MINKIGKFLRKLHRWFTPLFVIITIWFMMINKDPQTGIILEKVQRILMLTLAFTGTYLFFQFYYNKTKSKRKKRLAAK